MASKIKVKLILELRESGLSRNTIAETRHMSRSSVSNVLHIADEQSISFDMVRDKTDEEVYRMFYPYKHSTEDLYVSPEYAKVHGELKKTGGHTEVALAGISGPVYQRRDPFHGIYEVL